MIFLRTSIIVNLLLLAGPLQSIRVTRVRPNPDECANGQKEEICLSEDCIHTAADLLQTIDTSVDPCDDFYKFTCGTFLKNSVIPDDNSEIAKQTASNELVNERLKTWLEQKPKPNDPRYYTLYRKFYDVCMNTSGIETYGLASAKSALKRLGGWPVLEGDRWNETSFDWKRATHQSRQEALAHFQLVSTGVNNDNKDKTRRIFMVDEAALPINAYFFLQGIDSDVMKSYLKYLVDLAVIFGADREKAVAELKESVKFQIELASIMISAEDRRNVTALINRMTIAECEQNYPSLSCLDFINGVIGVPGVKLTEHDTINVNVPSYLTKLESLLSRTPKRVVANYIIGEAVNKMAYQLTMDLYVLRWEFENLIYGEIELHSRSKGCFLRAISSFSIASSVVYVRNYFNDKTKRDAEELINELKTSFIDLLRVEDWMDESTRAKAIEKAENIFAHVGYPSELLDDKVVEDYHRSVKPSNVYFEYFANMDKFLLDNQFSRLSEPVNKTDWRDHTFATIINAYYASTENSIIIPAAILQGVFFDSQKPKFMNYGSMGSVIGHELIHGFDDQGRMSDKDGVVTDWWSKETAEIYLNKTKCIIDQYNNYTDPQTNLNINGVITQGENIADNGGVKIAYLAYMDWTKRNQKEAKLPSLNYTPNQLFWISSANTWCTKVKDYFQSYLIKNDEHAIVYFRVIGSVSNSDLFAKDFNCKIGSRMNPVKKCSVW